MKTKFMFSQNSSKLEDSVNEFIQDKKVINIIPNNIIHHNGNFLGVIILYEEVKK